MVKYIIKQSIRSNKNLIKNYWVHYLVCAVASIYMIHNALDALPSFGLQEFYSEIIFIITVLGFTIAFIKKSISIRMHPASFHIAYNTKYFNFLFCLAVLSMFVSAILLSSIITFVYVITSFRNMPGGLFFTSVFLFFISCFYINWVKYKSNKINQFIISIVLFCFVSLAFAWTMLENIGFIVGQLVVLTVVFAWNHILKTDWGMYLKDMQYYDLILHASSTLNMALMQQIIDERNADKKRLISLEFFPLKQNNVLIFKALIGLIRENKSLLIAAFLFLVLSLVLRSVGVLSFFFEYEVLAIINILLPSLFMFMMLSFVNQSLAQQLASMLDKHCSGLFLPYSNAAILWSYFCVASIAMTTIIMTIAIFNQTNLLILFVAVAIGIFHTFIWFFISSKLKKKSIVFKLFSSSVLFGISIIIAGM